uniref:Uncharacterized protein n=1 Tax=Anopheles merus TaxID=30066 RepID=A0A182UU24_ANOME
MNNPLHYIRVRLNQSLLKEQCQMSRNSRFKLLKSSGTSGRSTSHPTCASSCFQPLRSSCGNPRPKAVLLMPPLASARSCSISPAIRFSSASCGTFHSVATWPGTARISFGAMLSARDVSSADSIENSRFTTSVVRLDRSAPSVFSQSTKSCAPTSISCSTRSAGGRSEQRGSCSCSFDRHRTRPRAGFRRKFSIQFSTLGGRGRGLVRGSIVTWTVVAFCAGISEPSSWDGRLLSPSVGRVAMDEGG